MPVLNWAMTRPRRCARSWSWTGFIHSDSLVSVQ